MHIVSCSFFNVNQACMNPNAGRMGKLSQPVGPFIMHRVRKNPPEPSTKVYKRLSGGQTWAKSWATSQAVTAPALREANERMPLPGPVAITKTGCKGQCCVEPVRATWPFVACRRLASTSFACQFHWSRPILPQLFRVKAGGLEGLDWQTQLAMQTVKTSTTTHNSHSG